MATVTAQISASVVVGIQEHAVKLVSIFYLPLTLTPTVTCTNEIGIAGLSKPLHLSFPFSMCAHTHVQTSSLANAVVHARTELPAQTMALVGTGVDVLLATLGPTVRPTSMTVIQTPAGMGGLAL